MKRVLMLVSTSAVFALWSLPALAAEMTQQQKDECLLTVKNCTDQVDDLHQRIHKLDKEIKKGDRVYSAAEIKALKMKLDETNNMLKALEEAQ